MMDDDISDSDDNAAVKADNDKAAAQEAPAEWWEKRNFEHK